MIVCIILILITLGLVLFLAFGPNDTASSGLFFVEAAVDTKPCNNPDKFERIDGICRQRCRNGRNEKTGECIRKPKTPAVVAQPTADKPAVVTKPPVKPTVDNTLPSVENCKKKKMTFDSKSKTCVAPSSGGTGGLTVDEIRRRCDKAGGYMPPGATTCDMTRVPGGGGLSVDEIRRRCDKAGGYMPPGATTCDMNGKPPTTGLSNDPAVTFDGKSPIVPDKNGNCPPGMNNSGGRGMCVANPPTVSTACPAGQMPLMVGGKTVCTCPPGWTMTNGVCGQQQLGTGEPSEDTSVVEEEARKRKRVIKLF